MKSCYGDEMTRGHRGQTPLFLLSFFFSLFSFLPLFDRTQPAGARQMLERHFF